MLSKVTICVFEEWSMIPFALRVILSFAGLKLYDLSPVAANSVMLSSTSSSPSSAHRDMSLFETSICLLSMKR